MGRGCAGVGGDAASLCMVPDTRASFVSRPASSHARSSQRRNQFPASVGAQSIQGVPACSSPLIPIRKLELTRRDGGRDLLGDVCCQL